MKEKRKQGESVDGSPEVLYRYWEGVTSAILASAVHNLLVALCEAGTTGLPGIQRVGHIDGTCPGKPE